MKISKVMDTISDKLPDWLVYERTKKSKILFISRIVIFALLALIFLINPRIYMKTTLTGVHFYKKRIVLFFIASVFFTLLPVLKLRLSKRVNYSVQFLSIVGTFLLSLGAGEMVFGYDWRNIKLTPIVFNMMIMFAIFTVIYLVVNSMKVGMMGVYCFTSFFAIVNYYVNQFRGDPINAADIYTTGTALNVVADYKFEITPGIFAVVFMGAVLFSVLAFLPMEEKRVKGIKRFCYIIPGLVLVFLTFHLFTTSEYPLTQGIAVKTFRPLYTYRKNGQLLNFFRGFYYMIVVEPEEYSLEAVNQLMKDTGFASDAADYDDGVENPNIIFIMNESLADFSDFDNIELSEDPMQYIHSLKGKSNAVVGTLDVDVFGGRTANSEYEIITGNSAAFFPDNAVAYALYVRDIIPSMTWNMRDMGYSGNQAFHPFLANGYSRPRAYPNLGFTEFVAFENIENEITDADYVRSRVSDEYDFTKITKLYEEAKKKSDAPFYLYNVTMQNHGGFGTDFDNFNQDVQVGGIHAADLSFKRYINCVDYTDEAFEKLTEYFSKVDEPTILVMYGDHLPNLRHGFYTRLFGKSPGSLDLYERFRYYETPLIVWANYDINEGGKLNKEFEHVSVNYLSSVIMETAGVPMTGYQKFLAAMHKEIPAFTNHGYMDKNGVVYEKDDINSPYYYDWVNKYHYLEYNYQFDKGNRIDDFFKLKKDSNAMDEAIKAKGK